MLPGVGGGTTLYGLFNKLTSVFYASVLLLIINFVITLSKYRAGNNFSSLTGHVSFQIFILVGHLINLTGH